MHIPPSNPVAFCRWQREQDDWKRSFIDWQTSHGEERARNRRYLRGLIQREKARLEKSRADFRAYCERARA